MPRVSASDQVLTSRVHNIPEASAPGRSSAVKRSSSDKMVSRGAKPKPRPGSRENQQSVSRSIFSLLMAGIWRFLKDFATFLVRGGVSSLMFFMDQMVSLTLGVFRLVPGGDYIVQGIRFIVWLFQLQMWIVYTAVELVFYLPPFLLAVYVLAVGGIYFWRPEVFEYLLFGVYWVGHSLLHVIRLINVP